MLITEPKTFHDAIKPLIYFNCFAGIGAFRQPNQSDKKYFFMKVQTAIIIIINWTAISIICGSVSDATDSDNISVMAATMRIGLVCANSFITVVAPFLVWLRRKELRDCVRQMPILDNTFQGLLGAPNEYKKLYIRLTCQVIAIFTIMIFVGICDTLPSLKKLLEKNFRSQLQHSSMIYVTHQSILVILLLDTNFCTFVGYLRKKFRDMNDNLLRLTELPSVSRFAGKRLFIIPENVTRIHEDEVKNEEPENLMNEKHYLLREIRKAHLELCKLSQKVNLTFGVQNLLSTGVSFIMITGLLYTIYGVYTGENFTISKIERMIQLVMWTAIYIFKIWMVNDSCSGVSNEADKTRAVIYELLNSRVDEKLAREIQEFGVQMLQNPVRFNACGFFTLDYTYIQSVIGSITTYLVILIQMNQLSERPVSDTALSSNGTEQSAN